MPVAPAPSIHRRETAEFAEIATVPGFRALLIAIAPCEKGPTFDRMFDRMESITTGCKYCQRPLEVGAGKSLNVRSMRLTCLT
jgi:hypothetical protein